MLLILGQYPPAETIAKKIPDASWLKKTEEIPEDVQAEWMIFTLPGYTLDEPAFKFIQRGVMPNCLCLTHGIGPTEKLANYFGEKKVVRGVVMDDTLYVAEHPLTDEVKNLVKPVWGEIEVVDNQSLRWSDVVYQMLFNALPALLDVSSDEVLKRERYLDIEMKALREAAELIDALEVNLIKLGDHNLPRLAWAARNLPSFAFRQMLKAYVKPSTLRNDLENKVGRSDAAYINGAVAHQASLHDRHAPVNHALAVSVTDIAEGRALWSQFRRQPEYLETIIRIMS
ncbi:MAG: hypothetical protein L0154_00080 [Chloroflexi bacterium]|nr:hypothetical protein [Chloroflexota bacterium]